MNPVAVRADDTPVVVLPQRYYRHHMWWLLLLPSFCLLGVYLQQAADESMENSWFEVMPLTSTYNRHASGYSGVFELAEKMGYRVERFGGAYRVLNERLHGTLVIVGAWDEPDPAANRAILDWVEKGNDLIYIDDTTTVSALKLLATLGIYPKPGKALADVTIATVPGAPESWHARAIEARQAIYLAGDGTPIAKDSNGSVFIRRAWGRGHCVIGTTTSLCSNQFLNDRSAKGNFQLFMNILATSPEPILFDERCHGFTNVENALAYLLKNKVGYIVVQLLLLLLFAVASLNQRFGQVLPADKPRKISNIEFIDGLSSTLRRARAADTALSMLWHPFKAKLCKGLGVDPHEDASKIACVWAEATGGKAAYMQRFIEQMQTALEKRRLSSEEMRALVKDMNDLTAKTAFIGSTPTVATKPSKQDQMDTLRSTALEGD